MATHTSDLISAQRALELALERSDAEEAPFLIDAGVVSFGRCMTHSRRRRPVDAYVEIKPEYERVARWLKEHRHSAVAHSEADTTQSRIFASSLDDRSVDRVFIITATSRVPERFIREAITLIEDLIAQLDERTERACGALEACLAWNEVVAGQNEEPGLNVVEDPDRWNFRTPRDRHGGPLRVNMEWIADSDEG